MKILALEFSSSQRSVAVLDKKSVLSSTSETGTRSTHAIGLIDEALRKAGVERQQIDCIAIGTGPGSYTGIRIAIAVAQGWQLARPIKTIGISSVECLAAQCADEGKLSGKINIAIDAQRKEFYLAAYEVGHGTRKEIEPLRLVSFEEVQSRLSTGEIIVGPDLGTCLPQVKEIIPKAATLGQLAADGTEFISADKLEPIYLRETTFVKAPPLRVIS